MESALGRGRGPGRPAVPRPEGSRDRRPAGPPPGPQLL